MLRTLATLVVAAAAVVVAPSAEAATRFTINCAAATGHTITTPGTHVLQRSVSQCASDTAILVSSSNVTLDLAGRMIDGDGLGLTAIRVDPGRTDVVVKNGSVGRFPTGVFVAQAGTVISGMTIRDHTIGVAAVASEIKIRDSFISRGHIGLSLDDDSTVTGNEITGNTGDAIAANDGNTVKHNLISGNVGYGVNMSDENVVVGNRILNNGARGITITTGNKIKNNRIIGNLEEGITCSGGNVVVGNVLRGNLDGATFGSNNRIEKNIATGNREDGLEVGHTNRIVDNRAHGNRVDGISIESPSNTTLVAGNKTNDNGNYGVNALGFSDVRARDNTAKRNGQPSQCNPESLC